MFDAPDQISNIESVPGGRKDAKVETFRSLEQLQTTREANAGIGDVLGAFSVSASTSRIHKTIANTSRNCEETTAFVSAFRYFTLQLNPTIP